MNLNLKPSDPDYSKVMNYETLPMLNEIELVLYGYIEYYQDALKEHQELVDKDAISIRKKYMTQRKEENKIKEELEL